MSDLIKTYDCKGCRGHCYGGYHMDEDKDGYGDWVSKEDHDRALEAAHARIAALESQIAAAEKQEPVGVAGNMPGTEGFTMAAFKTADVPVGTNLYTHPLPSDAEGLRKDAGPGKQALTDADLTALVRKVEDKLGIVWFVPDDSDTYLWRTTNTNERDRFARALEQAIKEAK